MEQNIAILIDFENIAAGVEKEGLGKLDIGLIMNRVREKGRILVARSYADWGRFSRHKKDLMFEGITLFELSAHGHGDKNRADVALVVDAMELAYTKDYVDTFVVISGDSDFTPLILKLRELNKRVLGCGTRRSTSRLIIEACDEFFFYDTLRQSKTQRTRRGRAKENTGNPPNQLTREDAMELVTEALTSMQRENPAPVHASKVKEAVLRKEPSFSETDLGFPTLTRFMQFCEREGIVRLTREGRGGGVLVMGPEETAATVQPFGELGPEARRLYDLLAGEDLEPLTPELRTVVCDLMVAGVQERDKSKRRVNLQWVTQDVARKVKNQEPKLTARRVRGVVNALHREGAFVHSDGEPVRSFFASFQLLDDATGLRRKVDVALLKRLQELGVDLAAEVAALAELLLGDAGKVREMQEVLAWEMIKSPTKAPAPDAKKRKPKAAAADAAQPAATAGEGAPKAEEAAAEEAPKPARKRRRRSRRTKTDAAPAVAAAAEAAPAEAAPAEAASAEAAPAEAAPAEAPPAEEAPKPKAKAKAKPKTRTRSKAKTKAKAAEAPPAETATAEEAPAAAADAPAEEEAPKPRRRRVTRKRKPKAETDAAKAEAEAAKE